MKLPSIFGTRGARDKPKDSYGGSAYGIAPHPCVPLYGNGEGAGVLKDPAKIRESWHAVYDGSKNVGRVAVLEEGMKFQQVGIPPGGSTVLGNEEVPDR